MTLEFNDAKDICDECGDVNTKVYAMIGEKSFFLCFRCYTALRHEILNTDPQISRDGEPDRSVPVHDVTVDADGVIHCFIGTEEIHAT